MAHRDKQQTFRSTARILTFMEQKLTFPQYKISRIPRQLETKADVPGKPSTQEQPESIKMLEIRLGLASITINNPGLAIGPKADHLAIWLRVCHDGPPSRAEALLGSSAS